MTEFTLQELADLEEKALAGDKNARETLDRMAHKEGFTDWESQEKECARILQPVLLKAREAIDRERDRREKTPGTKPVMALARKMMESENPAHRALIGSYPYRSLYDAAKKFEEEAANAMSIPETEPGENTPPMNIVADNLGGTLAYKRNEQGQTIIMGGTVNPGYIYEIGQESVAIKLERADIQYPAHEVTQDMPKISEKNELRRLALLWVNRGFVRMKGYDMNQFLSEEDAPSYINPKGLYRFMKEEAASPNSLIYQDPRTKQFLPKPK